MALPLSPQTLTTRDYTPSDYPTLVKLWASQSWPPVPEASLPQTGKVIALKSPDLFKAPTVIAAGFLYKTDSNLSWLEWIVADPSLSHPLRGQALDLLIGTLCQTAKSLGMAALWHGTSHERLITRLQDHGFQIMDRGQTHLLKGL